MLKNFKLEVQFIVEDLTWWTGGGTLFSDYEGYMSHAGLGGVG